jgi:hypothetical protein
MALVRPMPAVVTESAYPEVTVHAISEKLRQVDLLYEGQGARMSKLLAKYSAAEFAVITDFLERTTQVLAEEAKKLRD